MEEASQGRLSTPKPCQIQQLHCFFIHMDITSGGTLVMSFLAIT